MFVTPQEFESHLYAEIQTKISRGDATKVDTALRQAQQQVARFLTAYNTDLIFSKEGEERQPFEELTLYIKDIAKWHFIAICNVSVDLELAKQRYDDAIANLKSIQKSSIVPNWPLAEDNTTPSPFISGSQKKQNFFY